MTKRCFRCHHEKPLTEFYRHPRMADGHLNKCKTCTRVDVRINRAVRDEHYRAYDRSRTSRPHRREDRRTRNTRYRQDHPERERAYGAVARALKTGRLKKPPACEGCGAPGSLHAHHQSYQEPLNVVWLCARCHHHHHRVRSFFGQPEHDCETSS